MLVCVRLPVFTTPGEVTTARFLGNDSSCDGVILRFLADDQGGLLDFIGDTMSPSTSGRRGGVDGVAILELNLLP